MATQKQGYFTRDGKRVPSVTTVLGRFKESGGLINWAWKLGMQGIDYREIRDAAADAGTLAHEAVEAWVHQQPYAFPDSGVGEKAKKAFGAFLEWAQQTRLRVDRTEMPLVSEKYGFGGTFDALLVQSRRAMGDWKSSNSVYGEYIAQVAAYGILWEENFPDEPIDGGYHLLRFDKEFGDFHHHWWGEVENAKKYFLLLREAYEYDKELKRRAS